MNFKTFNFHPSIMSGIHALGYSIPTPIQSQAILPVMQGRDVIGLAQTGTGKTASFVLPILHTLQQKPRRRTKALIISPTRELAEQTCQAFDDLGQYTSLRTIAIYGGMDMSLQIQRLRRGVEIAVGCPGRVVDHLWKGTIDLSELETVVIDEADRMFDMGFLPDIRFILGCIMHKHQTLLFSATMPDDIRGLVSEILHDPVTVQVDHQMPAKTVSHTLYTVQQHLKATLLKQILNNTKTDSVLIFTRTKHRAENLAQQLLRAGHRVASLQGNMSQNRRQAALAGFRNGSIKILVATDIASRGIDVLSISHVINYDMPDSTEDYIHRIGRTGRVNKNGEALSFVTKADTGKVRAIEQLFSTPLRRVTVNNI